MKGIARSGDISILRTNRNAAVCMLNVDVSLCVCVYVGLCVCSTFLSFVLFFSNTKWIIPNNAYFKYINWSSISSYLRHAYTNTQTNTRTFYSDHWLNLFFFLFFVLKQNFCFGGFYGFCVIYLIFHLFFGTLFEPTANKEKKKRKEKNKLFPSSRPPPPLPPRFFSFLFFAWHIRWNESLKMFSAVLL